jgi:hypothetical protein
VPVALPGIGELIWGMDAIKNEYTGIGATAPSRFFDATNRKNRVEALRCMASMSEFSIRPIEILNCTFDPKPL